MGAGGAIAGMISSLKWNRSQTHIKKSLREIAKDYKPAYNKKALLYRNTMSPEEYAIFKQKLIQRRERGKKQFVFLVIFIVSAFITLLILL